MNRLQMVKDTLAAIASVKRRVREAVVDRDGILVSKLMGDLFALEMCLVGDTEKLVEEVESQKAA